jgi:hypothetical protein
MLMGYYYVGEHRYILVTLIIIDSVILSLLASPAGHPYLLKSSANFFRAESDVSGSKVVRNVIPLTPTVKVINVIGGSSYSGRGLAGSVTRRLREEPGISETD